MKSTVDEIRERFDDDVERFSNLETGQSATIDAPLALDLVSEAALAATPAYQRLLDVGCGAGNFTLKLLQRRIVASVLLCDLSRPMLDRAEERIRRTGCSNVRTIQSDVRELKLEPNSFDVILAGAVLHHLRTDAEWEAVFRSFHEALAPGGSLWIFDLVESSTPALQGVFWRRYGEYLAALKGEEYRDHVFAYIEKEDTPKPLLFQIDMLRRVGFATVEVLHKSGCFAAFGAIKG